MQYQLELCTQGKWSQPNSRTQDLRASQTQSPLCDRALLEELTSRADGFSYSAVCVHQPATSCCSVQRMYQHAVLTQTSCISFSSELRWLSEFAGVPFRTCHDACPGETLAVQTHQQVVSKQHSDLLTGKHHLHSLSLCL